MIARLSGQLEAVEGSIALVRVSGVGSACELVLEVLTPAYLARALTTRMGERVTFHTLTYLEGQGQGTSFIPRVIGFGSPAERKFFELFTTVKGIGNRKALRAMAEPIGVIAGAIVRSDARALSQLPEIGKRLAETVIAELKGKVDAYATADALAGAGGSVQRTPAASNGLVLTPAQRDAVEALVNLGEQRGEAERKVGIALERDAKLTGSDAIIAAVFALR
ncbi:MAG: Holliday junction branch migration protein RuvA [Phycisphaerales bacterium]